jgi:hypothetical protein
MDAGHDNHDEATRKGTQRGPQILDILACPEHCILRRRLATIQWNVLCPKYCPCWICLKSNTDFDICITPGSLCGSGVEPTIPTPKPREKFSETGLCHEHTRFTRPFLSSHHRRRYVSNMYPHDIASQMMV